MQICKCMQYEIERRRTIDRAVIKWFVALLPIYKSLVSIRKFVLIILSELYIVYSKKVDLLVFTWFPSSNRRVDDWESFWNILLYGVWQIGNSKLSTKFWDPRDILVFQVSLLITCLLITFLCPCQHLCDNSVSFLSLCLLKLCVAYP